MSFFLRQYFHITFSFGLRIKAAVMAYAPLAFSSFSLFDTT